MSLLAVLAQPLIPVVQSLGSTVATSARPILGLAILLTMAVVFKPMLLGMFRAVALFLKQDSQEDRASQRNYRNMQIIYQAANELEGRSPSMASELRALSARV